MTTRVLVVQPDASDPLDRFEGWFAEAGLEIRVVRPYDGEQVPPRLTEDALVVLGGDMSVHDDEAFPWLAEIRTLCRDAVVRQRPILCVCLGAQLLAQTFGGEVRRGSDGLEAGVVEVTWQPAAGEDALVGGLRDPFPAGTMHGDAIHRLPPESTWLGASARYPHQAFRLGERAWGVQFHPEISPATYRSWAEGFSGDDTDRTRAEDGVAEVERHDAAVVAATRALADRFATIVRDSKNKNH